MGYLILRLQSEYRTFTFQCRGNLVLSILILLHNLLFITGCLFHSISRHWPANALYQKENEVSFTAVHDDHNAVGYLPQCKVLAEASLVLKRKISIDNW
jgi:hypothetical protein